MQMLSIDNEITIKILSTTVDTEISWRKVEVVCHYIGQTYFLWDCDTTTFVAIISHFQTKINNDKFDL